MANPLQLWLEKKTYLEQQLAITSDPSQKFALREQIKECEQEIVRLSNQSQLSTPNQSVIQTQKTISNKQLLGMKLTGQEKEQLQKALLDAFNHSSLKQLLTFKLDKDLDTITTANGFSNIVFDLIDKANKEGWISQLIASAKEDNPGNQLLANTSTILLANLQATSDVKHSDLQQQIIALPNLKETKLIHILHLSDIRLGTVEQGNIYYHQLQLDLTQNLNLDKLDYLIISGDIANKSTKDEYKAASKLINQIKENFHLKNEQVIIAPGNHDLNWDLSEEAYQTHITKRKLPSTLTDAYIPIETGALLRDEEEYKKRFDNFTEFYREVTGNAYPSNYEDQAILHTFTEDKLLVLSLNSAWQIDHHYVNRTGINPNALGKALSNINNYKDYLKIAIWHHPVTGQETMKNTGFLEQLAVAGFEVCLHGHIHEAISNFYSYDSNRGLHIIGGGTFGAPTKAQVTSIPLQYNLLVLEPNKTSITVKTRKKEKVDGAWSADARWQDKEAPKAFYTIELKRSFQEKKQTVNPYSPSSQLNNFSQTDKVDKQVMMDNTATTKKITTWERTVATTCAIAILLVVFIVVLRKTPFVDPNQVVLIRIVLSLAIGIIGAVIPGFLQVNLGRKGVAIRVSSALVLFVISYFFSPSVLPLAANKEDIKKIEKTGEETRLNVERMTTKFNSIFLQAVYELPQNSPDVKLLKESLIDIFQTIQKKKTNYPKGLQISYSTLSDGSTQQPVVCVELANLLDEDFFKLTPKLVQLVPFITFLQKPQLKVGINRFPREPNTIVNSFLMLADPPDLYLFAHGWPVDSQKGYFGKVILDFRTDKVLVAWNGFDYPSDKWVSSGKVFSITDLDKSQFVVMLEKAGNVDQNIENIASECIPLWINLKFDNKFVTFISFEKVLPVDKWHAFSAKFPLAQDILNNKASHSLDPSYSWGY